MERPASPLASPVFRALWFATIVSNVGAWMQDVGAGWLMTSLSTDPLMVALVQSATTLPMFLLALPGGALADIVDRRRLLFGAQLFSGLAAALLAASTFAGHTGPAVLLGLTFLVAAGGALSAPAFQAVVPELAPKPALQQAVALNSLGINISRAIGPALGGAIIALSGPAAVFALNAVSFLAVLAVLARWRREPPHSHLPPEHFAGALRAGARYTAQSPEFRTVLIRSVGFFLFSSALWALLPLVARRDLQLGPGGYGGLLALMGAGAVAGALLLTRLRGRISSNALTAAASLLLALALAGLAFGRSFVAAGAVMTIAGVAWIAMLSSLNGAAQLSAPSWVKARALAVNLVAFQGAMTAGSALWGVLASHLGVPSTLLVAGAGLVVTAPLLALRFPLNAEALDLAPSMHWPAPVVEAGVADDRGPVMVVVEYEINPAEAAAFVRAMQALRRIRRRDGAVSWSLFEDAARPGLMVESFVLQSWLEHLRQHERVTEADRKLQEVARSFHKGAEPPRVRHLIRPA